jgi:Flp pilus assembly protein TadG
LNAADTLQTAYAEFITIFCEAPHTGREVAVTIKSKVIHSICSTRGVSMLEFALIAMPLFILIFGILEVGLIFWGTYELDNATLSAARMIRTGQAQTGGLTQQAMVSQICNSLFILPNCTSSLQLYVQNFSDFTAVTAPNPLNAQGNLQTSFPYQPGGPATVNLVTAFYEWPLVSFSSLLLLSNLADGNRLLQSSAVFKTEPYP